MYRPRAQARFQKDLKKALKDVELFLEVADVMRRILAGERLPPERRPHKLGGEYDDCWECHVRPDVLLIWIPDPRAKEVTFVRLGSHQELFG